MHAELFEPIALAGGGVASLVWARATNVSWAERAKDLGALVMAVGLSGVVHALLPAPPLGGLRVGAVVTFVVLFDAVMYLLHRVGHGAWWRMHRAHHAPDYFDVGLAYRDSVVHVLVYSVLFISVQAGLALHFEEAALASAVLIGFQWWTHTRIWLSLGVLDWVFIGPRHHYVHHAPATGRRLVNLGGLLCVWDQLFGTYQHPPEKSPLDKRMPPRSEPEALRNWLGV